MKQMKKEQVTLLLTGALSLMLLAGCGENVAVEKVDEDNVEVTTDTLMSESETEANEVTLETEIEDAEGDWLSQHNITITPQGPFTYMACGYDDATKIETGDFEVSAYAVIDEYTEGVADGYKQVVISYTFDLSANTGNMSKYTTIVLDRYTGTAFVTGAGTNRTDTKGQTIDNSSTMLVTVDEKVYDVTLDTHIENQYPMIYKATIVTCPIDYDGLVFRVGYFNNEISAKAQELDFSDRMYTVNELPIYETEYPAYYFTATDK